MGGDAETLAMFESIFQFEWNKSITANRSASPVREVRMIFTDSFNGCKITTQLQPLDNL